LQGAVTQILQAIYEVDFLPCSHGYRPGISAHDAIKSLSVELQFGRHHFVVEADIQGFFDNLRWDWLERMLKQRIADVLANVCLHYVLDLWFECGVKPRQRGRRRMIRYADGFVACFEHRHEAEAFERALETRLAKFGLKLAAEKTKTLRFGCNGGPHNAATADRGTARCANALPTGAQFLSAARALAGRLIIREANARASCSEEPGAGQLHAGICEGGAGQPASLPRR
jgi:retron-type reverse transcriptase